MLRAQAELIASLAPAIDGAEARRRIASGQVAYNAHSALAACGDVRPAFQRILHAFELAGFVSNEDSAAIHSAPVDLPALMTAWLAGDRLPRAGRKRIAREAAGVVANAALRAATAEVGPASTWRKWTRLVCPCCGSAPDIGLLERGAQRTLVCSRCDAEWRAARAGCLGCESGELASVVRIANPQLGYDLVICNNCGRFLKERPRRGSEATLVERAITAELDLAAEQRGLRI